jgi:hypothetical protein
MTKREARKLPMGLYEIHWKEGGMSLSAVGQIGNGDRWFAPCNWLTHVGETHHWSMVDRVVLVRKDN